MTDPRKLDALIAEEINGWVWQPVPWMNAEQSMLVPCDDYLKNEDPRIRSGDDVHKFVPKEDTIERLLALLVFEVRALRRELENHHE